MSEGITGNQFSLPVVYDATVTSGTEQVVNGNFASNTDGWDFDSNVTWSGGKAVMLYSGSGNPNISQDQAFVAGRTYILAFTLSNVTDFVDVYIGGEYFLFKKDNGSHRIVYTASATGTFPLKFESDNGDTATGWTIDGVSLQDCGTPSGLTVIDVNGNTVTVLGGDTKQNTSLGASAFGENTSGYDNTAIGSDALAVNVSGHSNTAIGSGALSQNVSGHNSVAVGMDALTKSTSGGNVAVGWQALGNTTTGIQNVGVGGSALVLNTTGERNTAVGQSALTANTTGQRNVAIGSSAAFLVTTGNDNAIVCGVVDNAFPVADQDGQARLGLYLKGNTSGWHFTGGDPTRPVIPASPSLQDVVDALVALGLVTQAS